LATVSPPPLRTAGERPQEELARLLVSPRAARAVSHDRIEALLELQGSFGPLFQLLVRHRLTALAGSRLQEIAGDRVPPRFQDAVATAVRGNRARALLAEASTRTIATTLEAAGIAVLPLKGFLLGQAVYGDTGLRELGDVDLLVAPSDFDAACDVLLASGYEPSDERPVDGRPVLHRSFAVRRGAQIRVELHWRIHWYESAFSEQLLALSRRGDSGLREPPPAHGLTALLLFWVRDGLIGLRYPADVAAWWDRFGTQIPPGAIAGVAAEHPRLGRALAVASATATEVIGLPPEPFGRLLSDRDRRDAVACRLANWTARGDPDQAEANRVLVDSLVSPPGGQWRFVRRQLLRDGSPAHPLKLLLRFPYGLWAVRGQRIWATSAPVVETEEMPQLAAAPMPSGR
jgi:Uncharacterised nucleotidyltransferase